MDSKISFEFFPPKTPEGARLLFESAQLLAAFNPEFFSVTYGAGGSTREGTLNTLITLQKTTVTPVAPHLSCIGSTRDELVALLQQYKAMGLKRIVAIRGDLPSGMGHIGQFKFASDLVALIRETTGNHFYIEVAAYPESHPQAKHAYQDILYLKKKMEAGANSAITQYFFNPDAFFYFRDDCLREGISMPLIPGIMPIIQYSNLIRFSETCGAEIPRWIHKRFEAFMDDPQASRQLGLEIVHQLCERLLRGGVPGLHFYALNRHEVCSSLLSMLNIKPKMLNTLSKEHIS